MCCTWHMLWLCGSTNSWEPCFFIPSWLLFLVRLKCCGIIHSSYGFLWVQTPPCYSIASPWQLQMFDSFSLAQAKAENWNVIVYRCSVLSIQSIYWRQLKYSCHSPPSGTLTCQSENHKYLPDFTQRNWELWSPLTLVSCITFELSKLEDSCM